MGGFSKLLHISHFEIFPKAVPMERLGLYTIMLGFSARLPGAPVGVKIAGVPAPVSDAAPAAEVHFGKCIVSLNVFGFYRLALLDILNGIYAF